MEVNFTVLGGSQDTIELLVRGNLPVVAGLAALDPLVVARAEAFVYKVVKEKIVDRNGVSRVTGRIGVSE